MNQHYMYFICETGHAEAAKSLIEKMSKNGGPGAIIKVTKQEMEIMKTMKVIPVGMRPEDLMLCQHGNRMSKHCPGCGRVGEFDAVPTQPGSAGQPQ